MKLKNAIGRLFSHNETIALWCETTQHYKVLLWRGEAWRLLKKYSTLRIEKFFGTIPQSITHADTINILIKCKPVRVECSTCIKRGTLDCPNSAECYFREEKPHWEWNESMWNDRIGGIK